MLCRVFIGFPFQLLLLLVLVSACSGEGYETDSSTLPSQSEKLFECDATQPRHPLDSTIQRFSVQQYKYAIEDVAGRFLSTGETASLLSAVKPQLDNLPKEHHEKMNIFDKSVTQGHIEKYIEVGEAFADHIVGDINLANKVFGACHSDVDDQACTKSFIDEFGAITHKRPLTQAQKDHYLAIFNEKKAEGYRNLTAIFLSSPFFVFNVSVGSEDGSAFDGHVPLSAFELAAKLAAFYLQSIPDEELITAASNNKLKTKSQLRSQIIRLMKLPKVRHRLTRSLVNQWLKIDETPSIDDSTEDVKAILNSFSVNETKENRRKNLMEEVYTYFDYMIWEGKADFKTLMSSNLVFPHTDDLAEIYGTARWNGDYNAANLIKAPRTERAGPLTLAHSLFTGIRSTRPIMRGVHIYQRFLCGSLPTPADNNTPENVVVHDNFSERERVAAITEAPGSSCVTCHTYPINPLGFAYEKFDSFGRFRLNEKIFYDEAHASKGQVLIEKPVNSGVSFRMPFDSEKSYNDGVELARDLANNPQAQACFARNLWRFANSHYYKIGEGECAAEELSKADLEGNGSILEMFRTLPLQPEFILKKVE